MGGCASVPKDLKDEVGSAPAPEPPMEETAENNEAVKVELEAVEKVEEENAEKSDDYKKSLGSLLNEVIKYLKTIFSFYAVFVIIFLPSINFLKHPSMHEYCHAILPMDRSSYSQAISNAFAE
jgi:predicted PurR-regulated permease PerM